MNRLLRSILLSIMLACSASAVQANSTYSFSYLSSALGGDSFPLYTVLGELEVADTQNALGSYDILGISGGVSGPGGGTITGLVNNPNQPNATTNFGFFWDNVMPLNGAGILFSVGSGSKWNLFQEGQGYRLYSYNAEGPTGVVDSYGSFSASLNVAPVPEPETYAMMLAGLGLIMGFASRRRQRQQQQQLPSLPAMA